MEVKKAWIAEAVDTSTSASHRMLKDVESRIQSSMEDKFQRLEKMVSNLQDVKHIVHETSVKSPVKTRESPSHTFKHPLMQLEQSSHASPPTTQPSDHPMLNMAEVENIPKEAGTDSDLTSNIPLRDLARIAHNHLDFLKVVYNHPYLNEDVVLHNAVRRYENLWLPLVLKHGDTQVEPPLDIHWMWHCHMLSPLDYISDCERILGEVPPHTLRTINSQEYYSVLAATEKLWLVAYPEEPFEVDYEKLVSSTDIFPSDGDTDSAEGAEAPIPEGSDAPSRKCQYDLMAATARQRSFFYQVSLPHFWDKKFLDSGVDRYVKFLLLKKENPDIFTVPMYDIDLIWHTHQLCPQFYAEDSRAVLGWILPHDDKDQDRSLTSKLTQSSNKTKKAWWKKYGTLYAINGTCYRGPSLSQFIHKDDSGRPFCHRHTVEVKCVIVSGCQGSDVVSAKICDSDGEPLLELPKIHATDSVFSWTPNSKIEVTTMGEKHSVLLYLYLTNCQGWFTSLTRTPLAKISLHAQLDPKSSDEVTSVVLARTGEMETEVHVKTTSGKRVDVPLVIEWGDFTYGPLPESPDGAWPPRNLPPTLHPSPTMGHTATHRVTLCGNLLYEVHIINLLTAGLSYIQVYSGKNLVATSEVISSYQLPDASQVESPSACVTLDVKKDERAMLIKNCEGDWGIVKGYRPPEKGMVSSWISNTELVASLTILSPLSTGTFSLTQTAPWKRVTGSWTGLFPPSSRMDLFGRQGVTVDMTTSTITLGESCTQIPEFLAAVFEVNSHMQKLRTYDSKLTKLIKQPSGSRGDLLTARLQFRHGRFLGTHVHTREGLCNLVWRPRFVMTAEAVRMPTEAAEGDHQDIFYVVDNHGQAPAVTAAAGRRDNQPRAAAASDDVAMLQQRTEVLRCIPSGQAIFGPSAASHTSAAALGPQKD